MLRAVEPVIPAAVITFVDVSNRWGPLGYFAPHRWQKRNGMAHEIAVSPKLLADPADLLHVLPHEATHAVLAEAGDNGGMTGRYYHRKEFREQARAFGLRCEF